MGLQLLVYVLSIGPVVLDLEMEGRQGEGEAAVGDTRGNPGGAEDRESWGVPEQAKSLREGWGVSGRSGASGKNQVGGKAGVLRVSWIGGP